MNYSSIGICQLQYLTPDFKNVLIGQKVRMIRQKGEKTSQYFCFQIELIEVIKNRLCGFTKKITVGAVTEEESLHDSGNEHTVG